MKQVHVVQNETEIAMVESELEVESFVVVGRSKDHGRVVEPVVEPVEQLRMSEVGRRGEEEFFVWEEVGQSG